MVIAWKVVKSGRVFAGIPILLSLPGKQLKRPGLIGLKCCAVFDRFQQYVEIVRKNDGKML